ncbi:DUF998 domain-containing protein [Streptomyces bambusae]|uniref:DUF998 domain-containing protein n=1 Tax=Streptomyces bambusae TaxID=1550616 RepID=UPI001CFE9B69|nr:DUF998 domain-containing protein [Streptomyces bambusae]MCB5167549.1 DUF998 domain-containing protein [Streptomyces bambusae]
MIPTLSTPAGTTAPTGSRLLRDPRTLLACGAVAGPLFLATGLALGLTDDSFDFASNALSQLSLGDSGWLHRVVFLATGALTLAGAAGIRKALPGTTAGTWAPRLVAVLGASFVLNSVFSADPGAGYPAGTPEGPPAAMSAHGAIHMLGAGAGFLALCVAFLLLAREFAAAGHRGWALACRITPAAVLAGFAASSASVLAFTAGAAAGLGCLTAVAVRLRHPLR